MKTNTTQERQLNYPNIPVRHWWTLREKLNKTIPTQITTRYLATALNMQEDSARANIMPSLLLCGLMDEEGKPTDLARRWRDDMEYSAVCEEIMQKVYPKELLDAFSGASIDRGAVERWFANDTGLGEGAIKKFFLVFQLLNEGKLPEEKEEAAPPRRTRKSPRESLKRVSSGLSLDPGIHIDIQVHIHPDTTPEQIDRIFASMAKHLFSRK